MGVRIDKWLWAVRVFKTRSDAAEACRTGKVTINGSEAKPSKEVKEGDLLTVKKVPIMRYSYKVVGLVERRLPAKDVPTYCLDITPQEELDKLNAPKETFFVVRDRGAGRPTKKERRDMDALWDTFTN
ncbi:MAG: RNA-binding S4 domain-containing protein [Tidjanibacter sp.]|nr:RNA-binding S4 domain-containing protein [Tidjanibacter sp.]MBQ3071326.1 RNA-binding S4 domain-containing protein [Tidjanibacter sp.]MBR1958166.1 RNA-binding S4 domain-containing protein [Tidjanibacter sp.]MBR2424356.1 RNA-binding S4 domain-containing protein [Tidjanibacter sp.]MBR3682777.1 RNA-binding S4 domain-containing protein [Tidjanibacter sp.]